MIDAIVAGVCGVAFLLNLAAAVVFAVNGEPWAAHLSTAGYALTAAIGFARLLERRP